MKFTALWTDLLLYLLIIVGGLGALYSHRKVQFRLSWQKVFQRPLAMVTSLLLFSYLLVAVLDSIHFKQVTDFSNAQAIEYPGEIESLLDRLLAPIGQVVEETYSAPFALHLFNKETFYDQDGRYHYDYPRLLYAAPGLQDDQIKGDISLRIAKAIGWALAIWLMSLLIFGGMIAKKQQISIRHCLHKIFHKQMLLPWHAFLYTLLVILILTNISYFLAQNYHILGTDKVGQDIFYQSLKSIRTGIIIGTLTTLIMMPFAIILGLLAGYFGGWVDDVIQYIYTTLSSIPGVLLIAAAILSLQIFIANHPDWFANLEQQADARLLALCFILGITSWTSLCRLLRAEALKLREIDYVQAAHALGVSTTKILFRHILPNVMHIVLIALVLDFSGLVLAEAVLSYVGVGVDPTTLSWGNMINSARLELSRDPVVWWPILAAFMFMFMLVLSANLFSDTVRDAFDPRSTIKL